MHRGTRRVTAVPYHLPDGYTRNDSVYGTTAFGEPLRVWPPEEVYLRATRLARDLRIGAIVDVGCGGIGCLKPYSEEFQIVGVDCDDSLRWAPMSWQCIPADLDAPDPLPTLEVPAVWVVGGVIERLTHPEHLVSSITERLGGGNIVVLSTPDRERTRGHMHNGPSPIRPHVQEWTLSELTGWLAEEGWAIAAATHIRNNDHGPVRGTCLVEAT